MANHPSKSGRFNHKYPMNQIINIAKNMDEARVQGLSRGSSKNSVFMELYNGMFMDNVDYIPNKPQPRIYTIKWKYDAAMRKYQKAKAEALLLQDEDAINALVEPVLDVDYLDSMPQPSWQKMHQGKQSKKQRRNK